MQTAGSRESPIQGPVVEFIPGHVLGPFIGQNNFWELNKNARRPKEVHIARALKEIKILDRAVEDLKELDQQ